MQFQDQLQRKFTLKNTPKRIISLVPSQTELIVDLGLRENLIGITKFCVHPVELVKEVEIVGGTKEVKLEKIKHLQPDLILCNKEENTFEMVAELEKIAPVHVSDISTIKECLDLIKQYGELFSVTKKAEMLIDAIQTEFNDFQKFIQHLPKRKVAYLIWRKPWMVAGGNTFINYLLELNHFENIFSRTPRYPEIELKMLSKADFVLLSSEPFPFKEKHIEELSEFVKLKKIKLVDGEFFSWYGSRLKNAFQYFKQLHLTF
ncbi:ABC-type Fe3+-hydroxamate transport system, substrate-binding protein [Mesonia phycicola]|uniref:ABC-type Fe3+-hydroxamate transport system, substrate-binding protein n=1 Tax=Mesonia phycicola TaxID=579105 RepID=A0A1M6GP28_9FLAO|nr:helical backbone metal receptor [Mesonia phycicola]SHJ11610.1 ABC-type Fe3+-hydroxamate transport system, substrate-binding protein [Mesonia phycicola]